MPLLINVMPMPPPTSDYSMRWLGLFLVFFLRFRLPFPFDFDSFLGIYFPALNPSPPISFSNVSPMLPFFPSFSLPCLFLVGLFIFIFQLPYFLSPFSGPL